MTPSPTLRLVCQSESMCWSVMTADRKRSNPGFVRSLVSMSAVLILDTESKIRLRDPILASRLSTSPRYILS